MLSSQMAQGRNRLAGKRVVIWQSAARELAVGDWRSVMLPTRATNQEKPRGP
jgi:alginate O-acetyltransferase complex protein AlgJ